MKIYEKTESNIVLNIVFILISLLIPAFHYFKWGNRPFSLLPAVIFTAIALITYLMFYKFTVTVYQDHISLKYGIGLINIKIRPQTIKSIESFKVPLWYGLGIKLTPKGMMYSIKGNKSLLITYITESGQKKTIIIGSTEPEILRQSILSVFKMK